MYHHLDLILFISDVRPLRNNETSSNMQLEPETLISHSGTVYVAVGSALGFVLLLISIFYIIYIRKRKAMMQE